MATALIGSAVAETLVAFVTIDQLVWPRRAALKNMELPPGQPESGRPESGKPLDLMQLFDRLEQADSDRLPPLLMKNRWN